MVLSDNKILLRFIFNTTLQQIKEDCFRFLHHRFDFLPFQAMEHRRGKNFVPTDVYGLLLKDCMEGLTTTITLQDKSRDIITLTFGDQFSHIYHQRKKELQSVDDVYMVVTSTLVRGSTPAEHIDGNIFNGGARKFEVYECISSPDITAFTNRKTVTDILLHCATPYKEVLYYWGTSLEAYISLNSITCNLARGGPTLKRGVAIATPKISEKILTFVSCLERTCFSF